MKILRGILETCINAEYLRRHPDEIQNFIDWAWIEQHRLMETLNSGHNEGCLQLDPAIIEESLKKYEEIRNKFEFLDSDGKPVRRRTWTKLNLEQRAEKSEFLEPYKTIYPLASQLSHATISGLSMQFELDKDEHRLSGKPSTKWCAESLAGGHMCMVRALGTICEALSVESSPDREQIEGDYHFAWTNPSSDTPTEARRVLRGNSSCT